MRSCRASMTARRSCSRLASWGATVMPHAIYLHSGLTQDRFLPRTNGERRRLLQFSNREVVLALGLAGLVNMAMVAMAASVFHDGVHDDVAQIDTPTAL
jgi:manganese transport protein